MNPHASHTRSAARRALVLLAAAATALGGCSSTGASAPAAASVLTTAPGTPASTASTLSASIAPSPGAAPTPIVTPSVPPLPALPLLWKSTGPKSATQYSFQALAVVPGTGMVWATVPFENRFEIYSPAGKYLESWGTGGTGDGQFDLSDHQQSPSGFGAIAFAPDGSFYVGDNGNRRVQKFDAARDFVKAWGKFGHGDGQFAQITSVATDGKTVYVGDGDRGDIQAFDANGTYLRTYTGGFAAFIAVDGAGHLYATNPSTGSPAVAKFDSTGKEIARFDMSRFGDAVGLAVDPEGTSSSASQMSTRRMDRSAPTSSRRMGISCAAGRPATVGIWRFRQRATSSTSPGGPGRTSRLMRCPNGSRGMNRRHGCRAGS